MPALRHIDRYGAHKAKISAMRIGESLTVPSRAYARGLRAAACRLGLRVSVYCLTRNKPAQRVTLRGNATP